MVVPAHLAAEEAETPADVGAEPFTEGEIVIGGEFVFFLPVGEIVLNEGRLDAGTYLDEPVVVRSRIIMSVAGDNFFGDNFFGHNNGFVLCFG